MSNYIAHITNDCIECGNCIDEITKVCPVKVTISEGSPYTFDTDPECYGCSACLGDVVCPLGYIEMIETGGGEYVLL